MAACLNNPGTPSIKVWLKLLDYMGSLGNET